MPKILGVNHQDAVRALQKAGFRILRQGKHIVMTDDVRIVTIPRHTPIRRDWVLMLEPALETLRLLEPAADHQTGRGLY